MEITLISLAIFSVIFISSSENIDKIKGKFLFSCLVVTGLIYLKNKVGININNVQIIIVALLSLTPFALELFREFLVKERN